MAHVLRVVQGASRIQGTGLFAAVGFAAGQTILRIDDSREVSESNPLDIAGGELPCHVDTVGRGKWVLARPPECYVNHACHPNAYTRSRAWGRELVAMSRIDVDDEITYDYSINSDWDTDWPCLCGLPECRGEVASFLKLPGVVQRRYLPYLEDWFVAQYSKELGQIQASGAAARQP